MARSRSSTAILVILIVLVALAFGRSLVRSIATAQAQLLQKALEALRTGAVFVSNVFSLCATRGNLRSVLGRLAILASDVKFLGNLLEINLKRDQQTLQRGSRSHLRH